MFDRLLAEERAVVTASWQSRYRIAVMQGGLEWFGMLAIPESLERHEAIKKIFHDVIHDVNGKIERHGHGPGGHTH